MSHVSKIEVELYDLEALKEACKALGFEFRENQKTYAWYGTWVGRFDLPEGISKEALGKCDHAVAVPGCAYEIGVVKQGERWLLLWDSWRAGGLAQKIGPQAGLLRQAYTVARIEAEARRKGYQVYRRQEKQTQRLVLTL